MQDQNLSTIPPAYHDCVPIPILAVSLYWPAIFLAAIAGFALFIHSCLRRRGWKWRLPLAIALMVGPYLADPVRVRLFEIGESPVNAMLPTTFLLMAMSTDSDWPYGIVFDRLHKAPPRHAMWDSQLDQFAGWCGECVALSRNNAMAKRGVQIAGTLAAKGCDAAIPPLGDALMHPDMAVRTLAMDLLIAQAQRAGFAREQLKRAAKDGRDEATRERAAEFLKGL